MPGPRMAIPLQAIETADELDALPLFSMVREVQTSPAGDVGRVWERRRAGWHQISGLAAERRQPALPVRLLWHPKWRELLT